MEIQRTFQLPASPELVFERLVDVAAWPEWVSGLVRLDLRRGDGRTVGDRFDQLLERGPVRIELETRVETLEPPRLLRHAATGDQLELLTEHRLAAHGQGTQLVQRLELTLESFPLQLMASRIRAALEEKQEHDLEALARSLG